ncbi:MAG TPA: hypothetical protein VFJ89_06200 [Nocardioides sp.]|nr:hypothetical protein [Nocardioides sp.]
MTRIEIRVVGDLGGYGHSLFDGFTSMVEPVTTTLLGDVADDAELAALRHRIRDAGLELVSIRELVAEVGGEPPGTGLDAELGRPPAPGDVTAPPDAEARGRGTPDPPPSTENPGASGASAGCS